MPTLGDAMFGLFKKKLPWEVEYAKNIYDGLVAHNNFGDMARSFSQPSQGMDTRDAAYADYLKDLDNGWKN